MSDGDEVESIREKKRQEILARVEGVASGNGAGGAGGGAGGDATAASPAEPVHVRGADHFEDVTASYDVVLVDYHADWCGPCQMLSPIVAEIARETDAAVAKVDIDAHPDLATNAGIRGVPTLFLYVDGEPIERLVGLQAAGTLRNLVEQYT